MVNDPNTNQVDNSEFCKQTIVLFTNMQVGYMSLASRFHKIKYEHIYSSGWDSFRSYCLEINEMSLSTVSRLINLHQKIVIDGNIEEKEISEAGWSKVAMTLPLIRNKDEARFWVDRAKVLSRTDLGREIREYRSGKRMSLCDHKGSYLVRYCPDCKDRWRDYDTKTVSIEIIRQALTRAEIVLDKSKLNNFIIHLADMAYAVEKSLHSSN